MTEQTLYEREEPSVSSFERTLYDEISADEAWNLIERFSDLERVSGTEDERKAAQYMVDRLENLGVPHKQYSPELYISQPHDAEVSMVSPAEHSFETAKTVAFSNDGTVRGEVLYVDPDDDGDDDLAGAFDVGLAIDDLDEDVEGKIVVVESILPIKAISELAEAGAAAFVGIHPHEDEPHEGIASPVWGGVPNPRTDESNPDIVVANLSRTEGDELLSQLDEHGTVELEITADVTTDWFECPVVVARIPGEAAPDNDDFVLLHGHYDSWFVGVTDNATGDAGLLESARVFNEHRDQLTRDLWVAWWPGHSTGRYAGSTWFADEFATEIQERCVAHVDMDSPGVEDATEFQDMVVWMPEADALCKGAIDDVAGKDATENRPRRAGDYSFNNLGITGMFALGSNIPQDVREERGYHLVRGCGGNSNAWHLSTDTIEKADPDVLVRDIRIYATVVARLLNDEVLPLDHRHTVDRHREVVAEYDETAGEHFDLGPVREELEKLAETVDTLYADAETLDPEAVNEAIMELSRRLVRVNFVTEGRYEQDPAVHRPPYPALEPVTDLPEREQGTDEYRFATWHLKRARNTVVHDLRAARRTVDEVR